MRLYYLSNVATTKLILTGRRIRLSTFASLNDPFELLGASIGDKLARRVFKTVLLKHWSQTLGIICFSETWQNPVMWAHYGDKHYGVCLGFDVPDHLAKKVQYSPVRLRHALDMKKPHAGLDHHQLEAVLLTKYKDWEYECERRVFSKLLEVDSDGHYYVEFGPDLELRSVILGARCVESVSNISQLIGTDDRPVELWKARAAFNDYKIVRQQKVKVVMLK